MDIPARPVLQVCPEVPTIEGTVTGNVLTLTLPDAERLRDYIHSYRLCSETNSVLLKAHLDKLENRLKALQE